MLTVKLSSVPNSDFNQHNSLSPFKIIQVDTLEQASVICRQYISQYQLGGGNWNGGQVLDNGIEIARISYNGRINDRSTY